ncbi:hypothetical protein RCH07_002963 [Arthrobacter sp. CG_A4]|nr:hypothetical protein [Arthrobacter sp. CG_A4]
MEVAGYPGSFLLYDQVHFGFLQAALRKAPGTEQAAAFLVQGQKQADGGAGGGDEGKQGEKLPAVLDQRVAVTGVSGPTPTEAVAVPPGEHHQGHDCCEGYVGPRGHQPRPVARRPLNEAEGNEGAEVNRPVIAIHRGNDVHKLAREQGNRESEGHIWLPARRGDCGRHYQQRPGPYPRQRARLRQFLSSSTSKPEDSSFGPIRRVTFL